MKLLEIAISTLNNGIYNITFRDDYNYLIIHQITNSQDYSSYIAGLSNNVRYIVSYDKGLSKSRNLALKHARAEYVWLMDDDVLINDQAYSHFIELVDLYSDYSLLVVSHSHENIEYLPGKKYQTITDISAANVSSIDMIINLNLYGEMKFNERFGLGSDFPSGEEYIFTCNLLSNGKKALKSRKVCTYHPLISSGLDFYSTPNKLKSKCEMFKAANGDFKGYVYYIAFLIKKAKVIIKKNALGNVLRSFLK